MNVGPFLVTPRGEPMSRLTVFFRTNRSFTLWDVGTFVLNFVVTYVLMGASLYVSTLLSLQQDQNMTVRQRWIVALGAVCLVVITYGRELVVTSRKNRQIRESKLIYDCIGGAIEQLIEIRRSTPAETRRYVNELLKYTEKIVLLVLREYSIPAGELCANLMVRREQPDRLELEYFGTFLAGRAKITLGIDPSSLIPGAPEACYYRKVMYINNTMSPTYRRFFDEAKPYRSIISLPIEEDGSVFAVLNIDSHIPDQFMSSDFINKKIIPAVSPLVALFRLEQDLIVSTAIRGG